MKLFNSMAFRYIFLVVVSAGMVIALLGAFMLGVLSCMCKVECRTRADSCADPRPDSLQRNSCKRRSINDSNCKWYLAMGQRHSGAFPSL